jgi:glycosyltransferase involved in cell wall biosynthesis
MLGIKRSICVILPTTASPKRAPLLWRALRSLQEHQDELIIPIVVVNGARYLPEALESLRQRQDIRCLYLDRGSHTEARLAGRKAVDTDFFAFLDDDDEYLPGTAQRRLDAIARDPSVDVLITNGYRHEGGQDTIQLANVPSIQRDPLRSLMDFSWLHSASALFRSERISSDYLQGPPAMELTYMALKLALTRTVKFVDVPTYRWYRGTLESLSATKEYQAGEPEAIRAMLELNPPTYVKRRLRRKYAASLHCLSETERQDGCYRAAWRYHLRSLASPYGIPYLFYTRHLLRRK